MKTWQAINRRTSPKNFRDYAGFIESWGHGTIKIVDNCIEQGLPEPDFVEENGVMTVTFYKDKWNEENLKKLGLNDRQIKAVMYVKENVRITNSEYQGLFEVSKRTAETFIFSSFSRHIEKPLDPQFPIVLQKLACGAWKCRFSPNRKNVDPHYAQ